MSNYRYQSTFKQSGIPLDEGQIIIDSLSESTLDRLTKVGFRRKLIKPVIEKAKQMPNGLNDKNINALLDDQHFIISLLK